MRTWKEIESPKLKIPFELREVSLPGRQERIWEVQELRAGCVFKVTLACPDGGGGGARSPERALTEEEAERAVCLAVEEALLSPPDKEPGITYELTVTSRDAEDAVEMS